MSEMMLIAVGCFALVAVVYGIYGSLTAGAHWRVWFFEQALPLYGVMLVGLVGLFAIMATISGSLR